MQTFRLCVLFIPFILLINTFSLNAEASELREDIDTFRDDQNHYSSDIMYAVFSLDEVLYENYEGTDENAVFEWGSITKLLTWVSVMQLVEQEEIDLDEDITNYLPDDLLRDFEYDTPVTMIDLMNHQAGFQEYIPNLFVEELPDDYSLEDAVQDNQPFQYHEPGEVTVYSNWGAALAGLIVEEVSGLPFHEYVHENILEPLDMNNTALAPDLSDNDSVRSSADNFYNGSSNNDTHWYMPLYPAGSAVSTLSDLITFGQALFPSNTDTPLFDNVNTLVSMFEATDHYEDTDIPRYAHGFQVSLLDNTVYGHRGNTNLFSSNLLLDIEEGTGYAVMTNETQDTTYALIFPETVFGDYTRPDDFEDFTPADISQFYQPVPAFVQGVAGFFNP